MPSESAQELLISAISILNAHTNMVDNFRIKTTLVPIESWGLELSNGTRVVFVRSLSKRFVDTNWKWPYCIPEFEIWKLELRTQLFHTYRKPPKVRVCHPREWTTIVSIISCTLKHTWFSGLNCPNTMLIVSWISSVTKFYRNYHLDFPSGYVCVYWRKMLLLNRTTFATHYELGR